MIGREVGNYRVEKLLGSGGMGAVYLVRHRQLPNTVAALKVLRDGHADDSSVTQRFVQEALVAAAIGGHRVARPLDLGRFDDGAPYILMELVEGRTLAEKLAAEGLLPPLALLAIAYRIADTMTLVHARGIVHRDLKPSNVMLCGPGESQVKLLDFGVARPAADLKLAETGELQIIGTPGYLSPEAATGVVVDGKADVFSFGVLLFRLATDEQPFATRLDPAALTELLTAPAPAPSSRRRVPYAPLPDELDALVAGALEKEPAARPTMAELRERLRSMLGEAAPEDEPSGVDPGPSPAAAIDPLAATLTHVDGASDLGRLRARVEKFAASRLRPALRRRWPLMLGGLTGLVALAGALVLPRLLARPLPRPHRAAGLEQHQVTFHGEASQATLSPDGRSLAFSSKGHLWIADLEARTERQLPESKVHAPPRWLSDSKVVEVAWVTEPNRVMRIALDGAPPERDVNHNPLGSHRPHSEEVSNFQLSGKHIDIKRGGQVVRQLRVEGTYTWLGGGEWSSDGELFLVRTSHRGTSSLYTLRADGARQTLVVEEKGEIISPRFATGGRGVLFLRQRSAEERDLVHVPLSGGAPAGPARTLIEVLPASDFSLSADGKRLAYTRARAAGELWSVRARLAGGGAASAALGRRGQAAAAAVAGRKVGRLHRWRWRLLEHLHRAERWRPADAPRHAGGRQVGPRLVARQPVARLRAERRSHAFAVGGRAGVGRDAPARRRWDQQRRRHVGLGAIPPGSPSTRRTTPTTASSIRRAASSDR